MNDNAYMREYMKARYKKRMTEAIAYLGGKCVRCGTTESLELDHIDASTKIFTVGGKAASIAAQKFWTEVRKCQLLCTRCHREKSAEEGDMNSWRSRRATTYRGHGSSYMYQTMKCKCDLCREWKRKTKKRPARVTEWPMGPDS